MSSAEQTGLTIVGGVVGFFAGGMSPMGAMYGAQIGYSLGASTLSTTLGPTQGPRIDDLKQQAATYGWDLPTGWGTNAHAGALMWSTDLNETENVTRTEGGGKGAPSTEQSNSTFTYSISMAVVIGSREIDGVRKIWANEHLIYENSSPDDYGTLTADEIADFAITKANVLEDGEKVHIYLGTETQEPDPVIQSYEGVDNTPAFRGTPYIVLEDLQLERFGNRPPQIRVEYVKASVTETDLSPLVEIDLSASGRVSSQAYQSQMSTLDKDLTAHVFFPLYGGAIPGNHNIAYYRIYPTGSALFKQLYSTASPGGGGYREILVGVDSSVPLLITANSELSDYATFRMPGGSILGGDLVEPNFPFAPMGTNGQVMSVTQGGEVDDGWLGIWDGVDQYVTRDYYQSVGTFLFSAYAKLELREPTQFTLDVDPGSNLKGVTRSLNYVYSYDMTDKLRQYGVDGTLLNTWDLSSEISVSTDLNDGVAASREDENIVYIRDEGNAFHIIDVTDTSNPLVTSISGNVGGNETDAETFRVWGGICGVSTQKGVSYYSINDISRGSADLADIVDELLSDSNLSASDYDTTALSGTSVSGFIKTSVSSASANIIPLQQAYQFSCYEDDHQLVFVPRGGAVDETIPQDDLGAGIGSSSGETLPYERMDDQDLPLILNVHYIDADLEYDRSTTSSKRAEIYNSSQVMDIELPLVFTAEQARPIAEILHTNLWRARESYEKIKLPLEYLSLVPTNIIEVTDDGVTHRVRVTDMNIGEFIEVSGHAEGAIDYTSTIAADNTVVEYKGASLPGPTDVLFLNLPPLRINDTSEGFYTVAFGPYANWRGCYLYGVFGDVKGNLAFIPSTRQGQFGVVTEPAGDGEFYVMDNVNTLTIALNYGTLSSVTRAQLMSDQTLNAIAVIQQYDVNGSYPLENQIMEVIRFQNATSNGDGTWTLSNLLRGQRGTEFAIPHMEAGMAVAVLDPDTLVRVVTGSDQERLRIKPISVGQGIKDVRTVRFTDLAQGTKPFSPCHVKSTDNEDGTFTIEWVRRPRAGGGLGTGEDDYQVEDSLDWQIEVLEPTDGLQTTYTVSDVSTATVEAYHGWLVRVAQVGAAYGPGFTNDYDPEVSITGHTLEGTILNDLSENLSIFISGNDDDIIDNQSSGGDIYYRNRAQWNPASVGETRYGIITGHQPSSVTGQVLQAMDFSGNPSGVGAAVEYIEFENDTDWDTGALSFWFKPDGVKLTSMIMGNLNYHIRFYENGGVTEGIRISLNGTTGSVAFTVPTSGWHHIAINRLGNTFELWLDGVYQGVSDTATTATLPIQYIGVHRTSSHGYHSTWAYDQFRVWTGGKALTQIEVNRLYGETA